MKAKRFIIFAQARTGSTTLQKLLNIHPEINCRFEPFNHHLHVGVPYHPKYIDDSFVPSFDQALETGKHWVSQCSMSALEKIIEEVFKEYNGIKHVDGTLTFEMEEWLLAKNNLDLKVIVLSRRNILQQVISSEISGQAKHWLTDREKIINHSYEAIEIAKVAYQIQHRKQQYLNHRDILNKNEREFLELYYEDLYSNGLTINQKLDRLNQIFQFLEVDELTNQRKLEEAKELLNPSNRKLNSEQTYRLVPNIDDIERELGCSETGYLFSQDVSLASTYFREGNRLKREGNLDEAVSQYRCYLDLVPNFSWAYYNLYEILTEQGNWEEAMEVYNQLSTVIPNSSWMIKELQSNC